MSEPPNEAPAADKPSETQLILKELEAAIDRGVDLSIKENRVRVCHEIEAKLQVPYGNVTKLVKRAMNNAAAKNSGMPSSINRDIGGAKAEVSIPPSAAPSEPEPQQAPSAEATPPQPTDIQPAKPKMSDVYRAAANEAELRATPEYKWLKAQVTMGVAFIDGLYQKIGLVGEKGIMDGEALPGVDMIDLTVQMCMKYDWSVPDKLEKLVFFGAWGALLILPPLAKFGILDSIKSGNLGKKKEEKKAEPERSDKPL